MFPEADPKIKLALFEQLCLSCTYLAHVCPGVEVSINGAHKLHPPLLSHQLHRQRYNSRPPTTTNCQLLPTL
jgi:hypothetical protein